jgi:hypothetical protein
MKKNSHLFSASTLLDSGPLYSFAGLDRIHIFHVETVLYHLMVVKDVNRTITSTQLPRIAKQKKN